MDYTVDAKNQKLGRLASKIASILQGKNSPHYNPRLAGDNRVIVKNVSRIEVSGRKFKQKIYYRHTGYIGHLKKRTYEEMFRKDPSKVLRLAVMRMLPKNKLRAKRIKNLIIE